MSQVLATGFAQEAATPEIIRLDTVITTETRQKDSSARLDAAEKSLLAVPGGVNFLSQSGAGAGLTLQQSLAFAPGVTSQSFFGGNDQPKIHVRGSGLQQNPVQRGLLFLADGLPLNLSDGSIIMSCVDPRAASHLAVYRGPTGNVRGAAALGGAIEQVSTAPAYSPPLLLSGEFGSFGSVSATAGSAAHVGDFAGAATLGFSERDGFRENNTSKRETVRTLARWQPSGEFYLAPFLDYTNAAFDVPGPLPWAKLEADPTQIHTGPVIVPINGTPTATQAGPNVVRDQPHRETEQWRGGLRSDWKPSSTTNLQAGVAYLDSHDVFRYPVSSGIQTTSSKNIAVNLHGSQSLTAAPIGFEFNWLGQQGDFEKKFHHNNRGSKGDLFGRNDLEAAGSMLSLAATYSLSTKWSVATGTSWLHETRDNTDRFTEATRPTLRVATPPASLPASVLAVNNSFARRYDEFLPQISVSFRPVERQLIFASVSRSAEVPTFDDLLTTTGGTPNSGPTGFAINNLAAQTATTFELGWRGALASRFTWDTVLYCANVENELLVLRDASGLSRGTVNADKTTHLGGELGGTVQLLANWDAGLAYTYQDFRFNNDIAFRNNRLAGAARHHLELRSSWSPWNPITLGGQIHWRLDRAPVDNANTLFQPRYAVCDFSIRYKFSQRVTLYAELRNAFDAVYAASVNTTDVAASTQAVYLPGDGRSLHAGFVVQF
ncbi:MAG: TonB-dependent receptor [Verrucomicrobia bacterium]|nr:TonB-dependent receptor [Verrucomicrobiota bacterium]